MKLHKQDNLLFCSNDERDHDYVRAASQWVLSHYDGQGRHWRPTPSDQLWHVFFGGRSGVVGVRLDGRTCCVKLFYDERLRTKIRTALGFAKGRRAYRNGLRLHQARVKCPQIIGYAERRPFGPALVLSELIDDGMRLDHRARKHGVEPRSVVALARYIRKMHDRGVFHVDLSPRNILIRPDNGGAGFLLLDYEDVRFAHAVSRRIRARNIHHLHERMVPYLSLRDRVRFLRAYAEDDYDVYRDRLRQMIRKSKRAAPYNTASTIPPETP